MFNGHQVAVARIMCILINGNPPTLDSVAAHSCGKAHEGCIHPQHLNWSTSQQNQLDRLRDGTHNRGERHPNAYLTEKQVLSIRKIAATRPTLTRAEIGEIFGTTRTNVGLVVSRRTWGWLSAGHRSLTPTSDDASHSN